MLGARLVCWGLLVFAVWQAGKLIHTDEARAQLRSVVLGLSALAGVVYLALQTPS